MAARHTAAMDPAYYEARREAGDQGDIFGATTGDGCRQGRPRRSPQSLAAYEAVKPTVQSKRQRVAGVILGAGPHGMTRLEVVRKTGFLRDTVNGRVRELLDDAGTGIVEYGARDGEGVLLHVAHLAPGAVPKPRRPGRAP